MGLGVSGSGFKSKLWPQTATFPFRTLGSLLGTRATVLKGLKSHPPCHLLRQEDSNPLLSFLGPPHHAPQQPTSWVWDNLGVSHTPDL